MIRITGMIRICFFILALSFLIFAKASSAPRTIEINCQKSFYTPDVIRVHKDESIQLIVKTSDVSHGFAIDEFKIATEVAPGRPVKIEFIADKVGEFDYYCVVRCGKNHLQMRGRLIVE